MATTPTTITGTSNNDKITTGSGNDTRRTLGIPDDISEAALVLAAGTRRRFDLGVCNGVYFNNSFAAGLDARVTAKAVEYKTTKKRSGLWLYLTALMHVLFHELRGEQVRIALDGSKIRAGCRRQQEQHRDTRRRDAPLGR